MFTFLHPNHLSLIEMEVQSESGTFGGPFTIILAKYPLQAVLKAS